MQVVFLIFFFPIIELMINNKNNDVAPLFSADFGRGQGVSIILIAMTIKFVSKLIPTYMKSRHGYNGIP